MVRLRLRRPALLTESVLKRYRRPSIEVLAGTAAYTSRPVAVIATFAWMAPALDRMPPGTLRMIDTIDVQHTRRQLADGAGGDLSHISCSREEEVAELTRADVLLAIQSEEQQVLVEMCPEIPVLLVEHAYETSAFKPSPAGSHEILCVGNLYDPNILGLQDFLRDTWPAVRAVVPEASLRVCGRLCDAIKRPPKGVSLEGVVPDLSPYYERAAVAINPVRYGSGLKIKSVEALAHGRCLVCTQAGTLGLGDPGHLPLLMVEPGAEMAEAIVRCLTDTHLRADLESRAYAYAKERYAPDTVYRQLVETLVKHSGNAAHIQTQTAPSSSD